MKNMFLASSFVEVVSLFESFAGGNCKGKTVTFIPTASTPEEVNFYVSEGKKALEKLGLVVDELDVSTASKENIEGLLQGNDFIYVSGGNTFFLLQELRKTGADKILVEEVLAGKPYVGESAGAIVVSKDIEYVKDMDDASEAPDLQSYAGLGLIDFYPVPHHTNYPFQETVDHIISNHENHLSLHPFSNSQAIIVSGDEFEVQDA